MIFSSDDRLVAAAGEDHLIHVFRALDGTRMALISGDFIKAMRFTEDGVELQVVSTEAMGARESNVVSIERHLLRAQDLISEGCSRLTRNLNAGEWKSFFDRQAYRKICMELP